MTRSVEAVLAAVERLPLVRLEIDDAGGSAEARVRTRLVARFDLRHDGVRVTAAGANGEVVFDLADARGRSEALAAIRRRVDVESFAWQLRVASP